MAIKVGNDLKDILKKKKYVIDFIKKVKDVRRQVDPEAVIDKVTKLQVERVRASSELSDTEVAGDVQKRLVNVRLRNQAFRSNIVRTKSKVGIAYSTLKNSHALLRKYIITRYTAEFKAIGLTAKTDREAWVDQFLYSQVSFINRVALAKETCEIIIEDIDAEGFSTVNITQILNLDYRSKYET